MLSGWLASTRTGLATSDNRELTPHLALRSDDGVEVGILGGDIVVRRGGWLARVLGESCPAWVQEVLLVVGAELARRRR